MPPHLRRTVTALLALAVFAAWHAFLRVGRRPLEVNERAEHDGVAPEVCEYERNWYDYLRGFDVHHGPTDSPVDSPEHGSFWRGLRVWADGNYLRGYTLGDAVYVCANCPRVVRVHQAGHAPSFGAAFEPLARDHRPDGGLPDEPLWTLDVMLPGRFPHTLARVRDGRGLRERYVQWVETGRIERYGR